MWFEHYDERFHILTVKNKMEAVIINGQAQNSICPTASCIAESLQGHQGPEGGIKYIKYRGNPFLHQGRKNKVFI